MRVLVANHTAAMSGAEYCVVEQAQTARRSSAATLEFACPPGALAEAAKTSGFIVHEYDGYEFGLGLQLSSAPKAVRCAQRSIRQLRRIVKDGCFDLVHANSSRAALLAGPARFATSTAQVTHLHDFLPDGRKGDLLRMGLIRATDFFVATSQHVADEFDGSDIRSSPMVVYNTLPEDFSVLPSDHEVSHFIAEMELRENRVIGVVGQLSPWKQQDLAIRAIAELSPTFEDCVLLVVGSAKFSTTGARFDNAGYERSLRQLAADLGVESRIRFVGELVNPRVAMRAMDALLMPSSAEPFGRVAIEAMAMSTPVLATDRGGPTEFIEHATNGYLLAPVDPQVWARQIEDVLLGGNDAIELGKKGRKTALERFSIGSPLTQISSAYEEALKGEN